MALEYVANRLTKGTKSAAMDTSMLTGEVDDTSIKSNLTETQKEALQTRIGVANKLSVDSSGFTSGDNGTFPVWQNNGWINGEISGATQKTNGGS